MELILTSAGSYPRIGDAPELQRHRRAYAQRERGEITEEQFRQIENELTEATIKEQVEAGLELPTDGQIRWPDPLSYLARGLEGVEVNGLLRFFDTNFYYRQPVVKGPLRRSGSLLLGDYRHAISVSSKPVKPVLTGPYTLARGSILEGGYGSLRELAQAYAVVLAQEVKELADAGAQVIQVDEPSILRHPEDAEILKEVTGHLARAKGKARLVLATYFGDAAPLYALLQELPVDGLHLDFTYGRTLSRAIQERGSTKTLSLGLIDGRNTKLETFETVFPVLDAVLPRLGNQAYLSSSCGLEYLPRDRARAKLGALRGLRDAYFSSERRSR
jgi:5-methyltetrahydropteroyltriglutamate--homocysteine methyltransferase